MSAGDSGRADMVDRLDAPFWVKAWNWMFDREEAPPNKVVKAIAWCLDLLAIPTRWTGWVAIWAIVVFVVIATIWTAITGSPLEF